MSADTNRWTEIRNIHINEANTYRIMGGVVLVLVGIWIGSVLFTSDSGYSTNLYTEFISIAVTVFILDFLNRNRERRERQQLEAAKEQQAYLKYITRLERQMKSQVHSEALRAVEELQAERWTDLVGVSMSNAQLMGADLRSFVFGHATLDYVDFRGADLTNVDFLDASVQATDFSGAFLAASRFDACDMTDANLEEADLDRYVYKWDPWNPVGSDQIAHPPAHFDLATILPDGTNWTPATDMTRFTNPRHPDFWRSENPSSPAYRGNN